VNQILIQNHTPASARTNGLDPCAGLFLSCQLAKATRDQWVATGELCVIDYIEEHESDALSAPVTYYKKKDKTYDTYEEYLIVNKDDIKNIREVKSKGLT